MTLLKDKALKDVDKLISEGVNLCTDSKLSPDEVAKVAEPVLLYINKLKWKRKLRRFFVAAIVIGVIALLMQTDSTWNYICVFLKLFQIQLLTVWDWTVLYDQDCLISNPYYQERSMTEDDCKPCTMYTTIAALHNVSQVDIAENYFLKYLPVVVTDDTSDWTAREKFSTEFIQKLYTQDEIFTKYDVCNFHTTSNHSDLNELLDWLPEAQDFTAHWFHCEIGLMKAFRKFYKRPYFLPPMVESAEDNYIIVGNAQNKQEDDTKEKNTFTTFYTRDTMTWFAQVKGQFKVKLNPGYPCHSECHPLDFILEEGQILAFVNSIWWFQFAPTSSDLSIALGSSGNWHQR